MPEAKFKREFSKEQLRGKHHITLIPPELNEAFLQECAAERRVPADMLRIILEDRYSKVETHYPKTVEYSDHVKSQRKNGNVRTEQS